MNLKGKIKSLKEIRYDAVEKGGKAQKGEIIMYDTYVFNNEGYLIEENAYDLDGSLDDKSTYKDDDTGNIDENWRRADGSPAGKRTYKYDKKGYLIESNYYNAVLNLNLFLFVAYPNQLNNLETSYYYQTGQIKIL